MNDKEISVFLTNGETVTFSNASSVDSISGHLYIYGNPDLGKRVIGEFSWVGIFGWSHDNYGPLEQG